MASQLEDRIRAVLACFCTKLGEAGWEGECCVRAGTDTWDECCSEDPDHRGGKAWARLVGVAPQTGRPADLSKCATELRATIELGASVCVCFEDCDCATQEANAGLVLDIVQAGLDAMACCADSCGIEVEFGGLTVTRPPEAQCAGFTMLAVIPYAACCDQN